VGGVDRILSKGRNHACRYDPEESSELKAWLNALHICIVECQNDGKIISQQIKPDPDRSLTRIGPKEARRLGVPRQSIIKAWVAERLEKAS